MQAEEISIEDLPDTLAQVAEVIGVRATMKLVDVLGGTEVYVPAHPPRGHLLCEVLGCAAAQSLASQYAGQRLHIARLSHRDLRSRDASIIKEREAGMPIKRLAIKYGVSERHVYRLTSRA